MTKKQEDLQEVMGKWASVIEAGLTKAYGERMNFVLFATPAKSPDIRDGGAYIGNVPPLQMMIMIRCFAEALVEAREQSTGPCPFCGDSGFETSEVQARYGDQGSPCPRGCKPPMNRGE